MDDTRHTHKRMVKMEIKTYILKTESNEYYCGKANNIHERMEQHKNDKFPTWFFNDKRRNFKLLFIFPFNVENKIKSFGIKNFIECLNKCERV